MKRLWAWLRRNLLLITVESLIVISVVGVVQASALPGAASFEWSAGTRQGLAGIGSRNLKISIFFDVSSGYNNEGSLSFRAFKVVSKRRIIEGLALLPTLKTSAPRPKRLLVALDIPYLFLLALGVTCEWLRRHLKNHRCAGFAVSQDEQQESSKG